MSKNEKSRKVLEKTLCKSLLEHNALIFGLNNEKSVTIKFCQNLDIYFRRITYGGHGGQN
jgi:hypothetical protein